MLAVATTHTVTGLNAAATTRGLDEALTVDGRLSMETIVQSYPSMTKAFEDGFKWTKIRSVVAEHVPELPNVFSDAANKSHGVHRIATPMQCFMQLHQNG